MMQSVSFFFKSKNESRLCQAEGALSVFVLFGHCIKLAIAVAEP